MMRHPLVCLRKNGPLQVVIMSLMLTVTSVVVDNNTSGLSCDRTSNDYTGWRKKNGWTLGLIKNLYPGHHSSGELTQNL